MPGLAIFRLFSVVISSHTCGQPISLDVEQGAPNLLLNRDDNDLSVDWGVQKKTDKTTCVVHGIAP